MVIPIYRNILSRAMWHYELKAVFAMIFSGLTTTNGRFPNGMDGSCTIGV